MAINSLAKKKKKLLGRFYYIFFNEVGIIPSHATGNRKINVRKQY